MGVMMQAFYWDCPAAESKEFQWWRHVTEKVPALAEAGFTALWLPPACKAANAKSMGYDPYDFFDLGEFDQKGATPTWFGLRADLESLIAAAHSKGMSTYADFVLNHCSGADAQETSPVDGKQRWTRFKPASGQFSRDASCFHPSLYETWDEMDFMGMPDLCHRHPHVYASIIECAAWLLSDVGFDGFRFDFVKGYGPWIVRAIQELRGVRGSSVFRPFSVGECWDNSRIISEWLDEANAWSDNPVHAFDFPLRYRLKDLCQTYGFSLRQLVEPGTVLAERPEAAVTFVENHDVVRDDPIMGDKMLAYAYILTHSGYPCVFWQDYFTQGLARPGMPNGIQALVRAHEDHAGGEVKVLHVDDDLYVMQRSGWGTQSGLVFVLNNRGSWNGAFVQTIWHNTDMVPAAWSGPNESPMTKRTDANGISEFWAPPRGYVVYAPAN